MWTPLLRLFFFSSRRRHTRWPRDWSSDVCSSDLASHRSLRKREPPGRLPRILECWPGTGCRGLHPPKRLSQYRRYLRSEERRVGKEWRSEWWREYEQKANHGARWTHQWAEQDRRA